MLNRMWEKTSLVFPFPFHANMGGYILQSTGETTKCEAQMKQRRK